MTKKEFKFFTIMEYEKEQEYLRQMHKHGWKFVAVTSLGAYHFKECEPEDVVYQLDYNKDGIAHKEEYVQMFKDCGWEYLQDYFGYSYFRKPAAEMKEDESIFGDDNSRLEMMQRVFMGRMVPLLVVFCLLLVPGAIRMMSEGEILLAGMYIALLIAYISIFVAFAVKYVRYKKD